jgi:cbb3-type cytochrome oxidase subunit 3
MFITLGVIYWFYKTAERLGSKSVHWAAAGAIAYQVPAWSWMLLVSKPYLQGLRGANKTDMSAMLIGHSWLLVGLLTVFIVYKFFLLKTSVKADDAV